MPAGTPTSGGIKKPAKGGGKRSAKEKAARAAKEKAARRGGAPSRADELLGELEKALPETLVAEDPLAKKAAGVPAPTHAADHAEIQNFKLCCFELLAVSTGPRTQQSIRVTPKV